MDDEALATWDLHRMWRRSTPGCTVLGRHLLRHALYRILVDLGGELSVGELVEHLTGRGYTTWRQPSRAVSDVLRTEVRRGRVERVRRGVYRAARVDRAHLRYVDRALAELHLQPDERSAAGTPSRVRQHRYLTRSSGTLPADGLRPGR